MPKNRIYFILAIVIFLIGGIVYWGMNQPADQGSIAGENTAQENVSTDIIYFYGETCPHCIELNKFLEENKIAEKVNFSKKEVWSNKANAAEMEKRAAECKIERTGMGVPFLYAKGKCYVGTPDVEAFFRKEAGI